MTFSALQDPRRYFEQTSTGEAAIPKPSGAEAADPDGMSTVDVVMAIKPHALQSGMEPAAAKQVRLLLYGS